LCNRNDVFVIEEDEKAFAPAKFSFRTITGKKGVEQSSKNAEALALNELDDNLARHNWNRFDEHDAAGIRSYNNNEFKYYHSGLD
jgi:hypothetical protein